MVKKRGGRRGKASQTSEEVQPKPGLSTQPSTSQPGSSQIQEIPKPDPSTPQPPIQYPGPSQQSELSQSPQKSFEKLSISEQPKSPKQAWGQPRGFDQPKPGPSSPQSPSPQTHQQAWGQPRQPAKQGFDQPRPTAHLEGAWGQARSFSQAKPGPSSQSPPSQTQEQPRQQSWKPDKQGFDQPQTRGQARPGSQGGRGRGRGSYQQPTYQQPRRETWRGDDSKRTTMSEDSYEGIMELLPFKPGTVGRKIRIETNHLKLNLGHLKHAFRYDVTVVPDKPKKMLKKAMKLFRDVHFPNNYPSYDGQKLLYSAKELPLNDDGTISGSVTLKDDQDKDMEFEITIKLSGVLDLSSLDVNSNNLLQKNIEFGDAFQCVEIVFRQAYVNSFINVGRRFYIPPERRGEYPLRDGAEMYLGGYQATNRGWSNFLNVDVAHKAFTVEISLKDLVLEMFNKPPIENLEGLKFQKWQFDQMGGYLKGLKVVYQIPNFPGSKKVYKVNGLEQPSSEKTFDFNGQAITVQHYFQKRWNCKLRYPNLPTVWVGTKGKILLPLECCTLQGGQPIDGSKVTETQVRNLIRYAATSTHQRKEKIKNIISKAGYNNNPCLMEFGFSVADEFQKVDARVLPPPKLQYSKEQVEPSKGVWKGREFLVGAQMKKWTIVGFGLQRQQKVHDDMCTLAKMLFDFGRKNGMYLAPAQQPFEFLPPNSQALIRYLNNYKTFDLVVVIFSAYNKDAYYQVKQAAELTVGCLTQCLKSDILFKLNPSTINNILLKINAKLNGVSHTMCDIDLKIPTMIMGADVTHPSPQARAIHPSVVAVTASHDLSATKYNVCVRLQKPMSEIIQDLEEITLVQLRKFKEKTGKEPKKIYFFRDGVSDGEFERVREVEIKAIQKAYMKFNKGQTPQITFLVVQKRHHTRFFPLSQDATDGDKNFNAPAGTCVDTVIVNPTIQNFYLLSHASIQGVARPTKYCVLHDDNKMSNDELQKLIYHLCHVFTRCTRAVSYPAPTYYAHLVADRAKGYLHGRPINMEVLDQKIIKIVESFGNNNPMFFC